VHLSPPQAPAVFAGENGSMPDAKTVMVLSAQEDEGDERN
jgi:hypothetical protein